MRIGVILSAGGSSFVEAARIFGGFPVEFFVVTDRDCPAEDRCRAQGIPVQRIAQKDRDDFSKQARDHFAACKVDCVILFFSRLIGESLFGSIPCFNVHPALLPAFPGLSSIEQAWKSGVRFLGATIHKVDETVDGGRIIAQTVVGIPHGASLEWCNRASFLQKTLVTLGLVDLAQSKRLDLATGALCGEHGEFVASASLNPALSNEVLVERFARLQADAEIQVSLL
jgi:phosphoribosylglycinamide formyltransferase-1